MAKVIKVVAAIVTDSGKILCVKRGVKGYSYVSGKYEFPGGKIESGEEAAEALRREVFEELDIEIDIIKEYLTVSHSYPDFDIILQTFICNYKGGEIILREHAGYLWLTPDKLHSVTWAAADYPIVEKLMGDGEIF